MSDDDLQKAVAAIKSGENDTGKRLLVEILKADSGNERAWLWMTKVVDSDEKRIKCFEKVLEINPNNEIAKRGVVRLRQKQKKTLKKAGSRKKGRLRFWLLVIFGLFIVAILIARTGSKSSDQASNPNSSSQPQAITTSESINLTVPGVAYTDGRTRSGSTTMMTLGIWDGVPRQRVVCRLPHGTQVDLLEAKWENEEWEYGDGRYYFLVDYNDGECKGWMPENFLNDEYAEPIGELVPY